MCWKLVDWSETSSHTVGRYCTELFMGQSNKRWIYDSNVQCFSETSFVCERVLYEKSKIFHVNSCKNGTWHWTLLRPCWVCARTWGNSSSHCSYCKRHGLYLHDFYHAKTAEDKAAVVDKYAQEHLDMTADVDINDDKQRKPEYRNSPLGKRYCKSLNQDEDVCVFLASGYD